MKLNVKLRNTRILYVRYLYIIIIIIIIAIIYHLSSPVTTIMFERTFYMVFFVVYVVYYFTLYPSVPGGDSGELLSEACSWGTAHPPGYPLFTMLSRVVAHIPIWKLIISSSGGSYPFVQVMIDFHPQVAWKVNHLCGVLGAFTAAFLWSATNQILSATSMSHMKAIASLGAFLYSFTPLVWEYSITAEVFALNNCLCSMMIYTSLCIFNTLASYHEMFSASKVVSSASIVDPVGQQQQLQPLSDLRNRILAQIGLGGFLAGLSCSNQHSSMIQIAFIVPVVLLSVFLTDKSLLFPVIAVSSTGVALGLSPYLYLPLASRPPSPGSWGDLTTMTGFLTHVLRREYGTFRLGAIEGDEDALQRIVIYLKHASKESYHLLFIVIGIAAIAYLLKSSVSFIYTTNRRSNTSRSNKDSKKDSNKDIHTAVGKSKGKNKAKGLPSNIRTGSNVSNAEDSSSSTTTTTTTSTTISTTTSTTPSTVDSYSLSPHTYGLFIFIISMWMFYTLVWHCVLSNLPLSSPMPFAVHSRFWMQPNISLYIVFSVCLSFIGSCLQQLVIFIADYCFQPTKQQRTVKTLSRNQKSSDGIVVDSHSLYHPHHHHNHHYGVVQLAIVTIVISIIIRGRYSTMDRSTTGSVLGQYATSTLDIIPIDALLLSHTDLDWNSVRYLQTCESKRPDVTHLSFQLMPYPWFKRKQTPLYPHVKFPNTDFPGVSTNRRSEGNALLVISFLKANNVHREIIKSVSSDFNDLNIGNRQELPNITTSNTIFPGGVYLDFQSVNEAEIGAYGQWRGFFLIPWGNMYRVFSGSQLGLTHIQTLHHYSFKHLHYFKDHFPTINKDFIDQFYEGSWEFAAASVFIDAHYQFGLNLLTFVIELQSKIELKILPLLLDRLYVASIILNETQDIVLRFKTISSSVDDLHKNTALSWMRLQSLLEVALKFRSEVQQVMFSYNSLNSRDSQQMPPLSEVNIVT